MLPGRKAIPVPALVAALVSLFVVGGAAVYWSRPAPRSGSNLYATPEAKAYVENLQLSDVTMQATENFMNQQVVEVQGNIANRGSRPLQSVDIFCLFQGIDGREIGGERLPIVQTKGTPLKPGEIRPFRLPFDTIPEGWNQAMPRMVIARITFAK